MDTAEDNAPSDEEVVEITPEIVKAAGSSATDVVAANVGTKEEEAADADVKADEEEQPAVVPAATTSTSADDDDDSDAGYPEEDLEVTYNDKLEDMTYGRWIARHLGKYNWYYPSAKTRKAYEERAEAVTAAAADAAAEEGREARGASVVDEHVTKPPSLDAAWAYFEHAVLPRYSLPDQTAEGPGALQRTKSMLLNQDKFDRAEPGEHEKETRLYPIWGTPEAQLADFGIGVGLYFNTLKILCVILFIAGLINIPLIQYYSSTAYSPDGQATVSTALKGSAICSDTKWVACPTCTPQQWTEGFPDTKDRYASIDQQNGETLSFILNNNCTVDYMPGLYNWISLLFVIVAMYVLSVVSRRKEIKYDEAQQTSTDYSIEVANPPGDATDPEEWREFFSQFGEHVTLCTVVLDNEELLRKLVARRQALANLQMYMPSGTRLRPLQDPDNFKRQVDECPPSSCWWWLYMAIMKLAFGPRSLYKKIMALTDQIEELAKKEYNVSHVYVTFETEQGQRRALEALSVRQADVWRNNLDAVPESQRFRGKHVLCVKEPDEPDSVRWLDLDETMKYRIVQQIVTTILTLIIIVVGAVLITLARRYSAGLAALVITGLNSLSPIGVKQIINFESHKSEGSKQTSMYLKLTAIRWTNTAIVTTIITPFTDTATNGNYLLQGVYAIFFAELVQTPIMMGTDYMCNLKRHLLGPRIKDQRMMIQLGGFLGGYYTLAERYTDMTKLLFVCFFYCLLFPSGFFFAAGALVMHYWTSKYCLLRTWQRAPQLGSNLGYFSRQFFFPLCILVFAIMSAYNYGSFPFDNACESNETVGLANPEYVITDGTAKTLEETEVTINISPDESNYYYCFQDLIRFHVFPPTDRKVNGEPWMTEGQETMTGMFGWLAVTVLVWVLIVYTNRFLVSYIKKIFCKTYKPRGKAMDAKFSQENEIFGYVPQVKVYGYNFPGLVCDIDDIDKGLVGWRDTFHSYDHHNLIFDIPAVRKRIKERRTKATAGEEKDADQTDDKSFATLLSTVKHWPPPEST